MLIEGFLFRHYAPLRNVNECYFFKAGNVMAQFASALHNASAQRN